MPVRKIVAIIAKKMALGSNPSVPNLSLSQKWTHQDVTSEILTAMRVNWSLSSEQAP